MIKGTDVVKAITMENRERKTLVLHLPTSLGGIMHNMREDVVQKGILAYGKK